MVFIPAFPMYLGSFCHVIRVCLPNQSVSQKYNRKKCPQTFVYLMKFPKNVLTAFDNHTILLF